MPTLDKMDLASAVERLEERHKPSTPDLDTELTPASQDWDLNTDFGTAKKLAHVGWLEKADELWRCISALAPKVELGVQSTYSVSGESVDVARFLSNEPECMIDTQITPQSTVEIAVNISAASMVDAEIIFNRGIALAAIIHALQSAGRGVSLSVGESVSRFGQHDTIIEIQKHGEYINPARLAFWLAHPAALRRCIFRYNEQQPESVRDNMGFRFGHGYGRPDDFSENLFPEDTIKIPHLHHSDQSKYSTPENALVSLVTLFKEKGIPISVQGSD